MGCCSSKSKANSSGLSATPRTSPAPVLPRSASPAPTSSPSPAPSSSEHKLNNTDLVFLIIGPAGSRTASFADAAAGPSKRPSLLAVPDQFQKSNIYVRRTAVSQKQVVLIVPQEFEGDNVKETHVVSGVQEWLATENDCQNHPFVDYILFLSEPMGILGIQLQSPFRYSKISFITRVGPDENGHERAGVPGAWEAFVKKGCPVYTFEGTAESARSVLSKIVR